MQSLYDNFYNMTRVELNNLAKNRFIDSKMQLWIATQAHLQARYYLAENPNLCNRAIDEMWSGRSIIVKCILAQSGHIIDQDRIRSLYEQFMKKARKEPSNLGAKNNMDYWRLRCTFIHDPWTKGRSHTPSDVLADIYKFINKEGNSYHNKYILEDILEHTNLSLELALHMTHDARDDIRKKAFNKVVKLSS